MVTEDHTAWNSAANKKKKESFNKKEARKRETGQVSAAAALDNGISFVSLMAAASMYIGACLLIVCHMFLQASRGKAFVEDEKRQLRQYEAGGN